MLQTGWAMALTHYLLLLFLLVLQVPIVQSAPVAGQGAGKDYDKDHEEFAEGFPEGFLEEFDEAFPEGAPEEFPEGFPEVPDELLTDLDEAPSEIDAETVPEPLPVEESVSMPGSDEGTKPIMDTSTLAEPEQFSGSAKKAKTDGQRDLSKSYILWIIAASVLFLLVAVFACIVMYKLLKRHTKNKEDKEAPRQVSPDSSWACHGQPRDGGETEAGEGAGRGERAQANRFGDSCHLFPEVFAAELAQLYKNMGADPSPLPMCPFCALADGASSRDHWISLDSPQPTPYFCSCYQYQQEHFILEDKD